MRIKAPPLAYEIGQIRELLVNEIDIGRDSHESFDDRIVGQISTSKLK